MQDSKKLYAEIALDLPLERTFHYSIPAKLKKNTEVGKRAWVEFGNKEKVGYIVGFAEKADVPNTKPIKSIIDETPIISPGMLDRKSVV